MSSSATIRLRLFSARIGVPGTATIRLSTCLGLFLCNPAWLPAQAPGPTIANFVNAATYQNSASVPVAARGSLIAIFGSNLATAEMSPNGFPLPTQMAGTSVLFGGIPAPLLYVSPTQINAQVPFEIPDMSSVSMVIQTGNGGTTSLQVVLLAQDPAIFSVWRYGSPVSSSNPIAAGDPITIYATGLGSVLPAVASGQVGPSSPPAMAAINPIVQLGGRTVNADFAGMAPGQVIYQINATAPSDLAAPTIVVTLGTGVIPAVVGPPGPAGLIWRGTWNATSAYAMNDAGAYKGSSYVVIQPGTNNEPDTSSSFWTVLSMAGAAGAAGAGLSAPIRPATRESARARPAGVRRAPDACA